MKRQDWLYPACVLALIGALLFAASCSGIIYVEDCQLVTKDGTKTYWKCKR